MLSSSSLLVLLVLVVGCVSATWYVQFSQPVYTVRSLDSVATLELRLVSSSNPPATPIDQVTVLYYTQPQHTYLVEGWTLVNKGQHTYRTMVNVSVNHLEQPSQVLVKLSAGSSGLELGEYASARLEIEQISRDRQNEGVMEDTHANDSPSVPSFVQTPTFIGTISAAAAAAVVGAAAYAVVRIRRARRGNNNADAQAKVAAAKRKKFFHRRRSSSIDSKRLENVLPPLPPPPEICANAAIQSIAVDLDDISEEPVVVQQTTLKRFNESPQRQSPVRSTANVPGTGRLELGVKISNQQFARPRQSSYVKSTMPVQISEEFKDDDSDNEPGTN